LSQSGIHSIQDIGIEVKAKKCPFLEKSVQKLSKKSQKLLNNHTWAPDFSQGGRGQPFQGGGGKISRPHFLKTILFKKNFKKNFKKKFQKKSYKKFVQKLYF
jgi:hypothetical protein